MQDKKKGSTEMYKVQIECIFDDLSDAQIKAYKKRTKEFNEFLKKFDAYTANRAELNIERGDLCTFVEFVHSSTSTIQSTIPVVNVNSQSMQKPNGRVTATTPPQNNQILLVNNKMGLTGYIVPTSVVTGSGGTNVPPVSVVNVAGTNVTVTSSPIAQSLLTSVKPPIAKIASPQLAVSNQNHPQSKIPKVVDNYPGKILINRPEGNIIGQKRHLDLPMTISPKPTFYIKPAPILNKTPVSSLNTTPKSAVTPKPDTDSVTPPPPKKLKTYPIPQPTVSIDLTEDLSKIETSSGSCGKTYPSLVVMARPCMRNEKEAKSPHIVKEKQALDTQVRRVLLFTPKNFTEWLIQTGLLRCDHYCSIHTADDGSKIKLKLGQYTDSNKFPFSGGYVWISDCCPQTYISVFSGSVFEGASYPPTTTMKLIYHWACHTSIQNILQWVNVSNVYIKNLFTNLRAVCTAAIHEHYELLGGAGKKIQVGVVSLGTSQNDNIPKRIRVDILCVLDPETKIVRIRAVEPTVDPERFVLRKFTKIFEILPSWVDKETTILVDNTVERSVLLNLGFKSLQFTKIKDKKGQDQFPNYEVMDYLRMIVPKMFQNTLGILSRQVIQQFLDELCWRERWGPFPSRAFDTIIKHLIEQTKINSGATLLNRLSKISSNPFKDWKYSKWRGNCISRPSGSGTPKPPGPPLAIVGCGGQPQKIAVTVNTQLIEPPQVPHLQPAQPEKQSDLELPSPVTLNPTNNQPSITIEAAKILLEPYFYGTLKGDEALLINKIDFSSNCVICRKMFTNNLELTDHLIRHGIATLQNESKELCKICCKIFPSLYFLQQHHVQAHSASPAIPNSSQWCLMCNVRYRDLNSLICHMSKYHGELELPYICTICQYRTSIFMSMVQHVNDHKSDDTGFCPYCFQVFHFYQAGKPSVKNQYKFIYHIQRHQLPLAKKCYKCITTCLNKTLLNEHESKDHISFANDNRIERYSPVNNTYMPAPLDDPVPPKGDRFKLALGGPYKVVNFPNPLNLDEKDEETVCIECDAKINDNHFISELLCMKCDYSTCCIRAMNEHHQSAHSFPSTNIKFYKSIPVISDTNLNCSCGFTTKDGNLMADHLISCKKKTCYGDPKIMDSSINIKSLIGQGASEDEETEAEKPEMNTTYTIGPSYRPGPSSSRKDINNATFTVSK